MTASRHPAAQPGTRRVTYQVHAPRLWTGGLMTGIVAGLTMLVGILFVNGILGLNVVEPDAAGVTTSPSTLQLILASFAAALVATGVMHLLLLGAPQPWVFFSWIGGLGILAATALPFALDVRPADALASAALNLTVGAVIVGLVQALARSATRRVLR